MKNQIQSKVHHAQHNWYLWLFPIFAVMISGYLIFHSFFVHERVIKIDFDDVAGIQAEKTQVRFRGVEVGVVKQTVVSKDQKSIIVSVALNRDAESFAVEGTKFWIVTPKVSFQGLSGLDTIFSGPYIEVSPGPADGDKQMDFKGRHDSETGSAVEATTAYFVETPSAESITSGDSITYRGITIGETGKLILSKSGQSVEIQINIQNKYVKLIRENTIFWRRVGIQANLGLFGSDIKVNSLDSIMHGGMAFATPDKAAGIAKAGTHFILAPESPKNSAKWQPIL